MPTDENRRQLFDDWAKDYDRMLARDSAAQEGGAQEGGAQEGADFPFDGYERVLDEIVSAAEPRAGMQVLDLGIGTGKLAARFAGLGCEIWGIDFSAQMLARARERVPDAVLVQGDLLGEWPAPLDRRFDRVVSAYVLHEFDLSTKVALLQRWVEGHLAAHGRIVIGDIAFPTAQARDLAHSRWADAWDEEEAYWAAGEAMAACARVGLEVRYRQISSCGGVFVVEAAGSG
jgi:putative AdoMet-dependent methyltransferase